MTLARAYKLQLFKMSSYVGTACKPVLGTLNQKARTGRFWMLQSDERRLQAKNRNKPPSFVT
jgi:hypothetical protein